jgi:hypothetical protein
MKVTRKILLLTVAAGVLFTSLDAEARRRGSRSAELDCSNNPAACQTKITDLERQKAGLINALKKCRDGSDSSANDSVPTVNSTDDNDDPVLAREIQSVIDRSKNMLGLVGNHFDRGKNIPTFNKFHGRAQDRARAALGRADRGTQVYKEMQSIVARLGNIEKEMEGLKGRVRMNQLTATADKVREQLTRIKDRAESAVDANGGDNDFVVI